jgi:hypothetical protein
MASSAVWVCAPAGQLLEIVAGAECRPMGGEHDSANVAVGRNVKECVIQRAQQPLRQAVARRRPVERQHRDRAAVLAKQNRIASGRSGGMKVHRSLCTSDSLLYPI